MLPAFVATAIWIPAVLGLGMLLPFDPDDDLRVAVAGFAGLAVLSFAATVAGFAIPVSGGFSLGLLATGYAVFLVRGKRLFPSSSPRALALHALALLALSFFVQNPDRHYDAGLYQLQAVKWMTESRLVLGLANLHGRLGFNSAWLATAASLELPGLAGKSAFVASLLAPLFAATAAGNASRALLAGDRRFATIVTAGLWLPVAGSAVEVGSLDSDQPSALLAYLAVAVLVRAMRGREDLERHLAPLALLAAYATTVKLSTAVVPLAVIGLAIARREWLARRATALAVGVAALAVVPWAVRGLLVSGCVAYPVAASCLPGLYWGVPLPLVRDEADWIRSWARLPGVPHEVVLASAGWLGPWAEAQLGNPVLQVGAALFGVGIVLAFRRRAVRLPVEVWVASAIAAASLLYWAWAAPNPRFATGFILLAAALPLCAAVARENVSPRRARAVLLAGAAFLFVASATPVKRFTSAGVNVASWPAFPSVATAPRATDSGLAVQVPVSGDRCWLAPRPCTPYFRPELVLDGAFRTGSSQPARTEWNPAR